MHIGITGNIGAGKTTLAIKLAEYFGWNVLFEEVENNPYLPLFYKDMDKWAFHLQIFFLNSRFQQAQIIEKRDEEITFIQDRTIYEDCYIFAQNLFNNGILTETDFKTYKSMFESILKTLRPPNLLIYLKSDLNKLKKQISKRGREYEKEISDDYLESLNKLYEQFSLQYKNANFIEIDISNMDFVNNEADFQFIVNKINKHINLGKQLSI